MEAALTVRDGRRGRPSPWQACVPEPELWAAVMRAVMAGRSENYRACGASRLVCRAWAAAWGPGDLVALRVPSDAECLPSNWPHRVPNLTSLDFSGWRYSYELSDTTHLVPPLRHLTCLTSLDLSLCEVVSAEVLDTLLHLTALTSLNLSQCSPLPDYGLTSLRSLTRLVSLNLMQYGMDFDEWTDDRLLTFLPCLTSLTELQLSACGGITEEGLVALQGLTRLTSLDLSNSLIEDEWLTSLYPLTNLSTLGLENCPLLHGHGLSPLRSLRVLNACGTLLSSEGLQALQPLTGLTSLHLDRQCAAGSEIFKDEEVTALHPLTALTCLNLSFWELTGEGLGALRAFTGLTCLDLIGCTLVDAQLTALQPLTGLTNLRLSWNPLSAEGFKALRPLTALSTLDANLIKPGEAPPELTHLTSLSYTCTCQGGSTAGFNQTPSIP